MSHAAGLLLIGAKGMLGRAWSELLTGQAVPHDAVDVDECDITDSNAVARWIAPGRQAVINCAAYTNVDAAETDEPAAELINAVGPGNLATRCNDTRTLLVHYSTDYVFDGQAASAYPTDAPRKPLGAYGRTKAHGEQAIEQSGCDHLIVRTSWLYAPWAKNFVTTMVRLTAERDELRVVNDQTGRPTSAQHLAETTWRLIQAEARGVYHVTDGGQCTWYELTCQIAELTGADCRVSPCTTAEFPRPAPRPGYSVLDLAKTETRLGPMTPWPENLAAVIRRMDEGTRDQG